jgi:hypothetical protein
LTSRGATIRAARMLPTDANPPNTLPNKNPKSEARNPKQTTVK